MTLYMKGVLKNLGLIGILIGVLTLIVCAFTGYVNNNVLLGGCAALIVAGLVVYIVINKRLD